MPAIRIDEHCARAVLRPVRVFLAAAAMAGVAACATTPVGTPLQSTASAEAPRVAPGDSWTYRVRDGYTGLDRGNEQYSVTGTSGERISVTVSFARSGVEEAHVYDRNWNWLKRPATNLQSFDYQPSYQAFAFPLTPGKTWSERLEATDPGDGRKFPVRLYGTVVGWERIKVPAGEFDTIRIKRSVYFDYWEYSTRGGSDMVESEWYAPAVKQVVRRETASWYVSYVGGDAPGFMFVDGDTNDGGGIQRVPDDWLIYELVSYSVR